MADGIFVPPHLQIDPLRPVQFFTQGAATGVQAGEARNRAQQAAAALAVQAQARAAEQQIAEMRALSDAAQFSAQLALRQEENKRKAAASARQYEAAENIRRAIASGVPPEQAFFQNPQYFMESPAAIPSLINALKPPEPTAAIQNAREITRLQGLSPQDAARQQAALLESTMMTPGEVVEMGMDERGQPTFTRRTGAAAKAAGGLTVGTQTEIQKALMNYEGPMATISDLEKTLRPGDVGVRGVVGGYSDRWLGQVKPAMADITRMTNNEKMKLLRTQMYKTLRSDSQITKEEQKQIMGMLPNQEEIDESYPNALAQMKVVKQHMIQSARTKAAAAKQPPPVWALTPAEISDMNAKGQLSDQQALNLLREFHPDFGR